MTMFVKRIIICVVGVVVIAGYCLFAVQAWADAPKAEMLVTVNGRDMWESTCHDCGIRFSRPDYRRMQEQMMNRAG